MNGEYNNGVVRRSEVNGIWKPGKYRAPDLAVRARELKRVSAQASHQGIRRLDELLTQAGPPRLIPLSHVDDFVCGLGPEDDFSRHV